MSFKNDLNQPYETWMQTHAPRWPLIKHRIQMATFGAFIGVVLALLVTGVVMFTMPDRLTGGFWVGMGVMACGGAFSTLIQNWNR